MSLNWDSTRCNPPLPTDKSDEVLQNVLVFGLMAIGQREITEKNLDECWLRFYTLERISSPFRNRVEEKGVVPVYLTRDEVKRWVGLSTNVTNEARAAWLKRIVDSVDRDLKYRSRRAADAAAREAVEAAS